MRENSTLGISGSIPPIERQRAKKRHRSFHEIGPHHWLGTDGLLFLLYVGYFDASSAVSSGLSATPCVRFKNDTISIIEVHWCVAAVKVISENLKKDSVRCAVQSLL